MLEFKTANFVEPFKSCFINKHESDTDEEIAPVKILTASKSNGVLTTKEVWPAAPLILNITANHELYAARAPMKGSQYNAPRLKQEYLAENPLKLTVTPYPENETVLPCFCTVTIRCLYCYL